MRFGVARHKPTEVQFRKPRPLETHGGYGMTTEPKKGETVQTGHGPALAIVGEDLIIKDEKGEYPITKDIFEKTYDVIEPITEKEGQ